MKMIFSIQAWLIFMKLLLSSLQWIDGAVAAPPWANPKLNPCASHPMGWQMLYWPPDGKCYKIFQVGHPCPPDMELTPTAHGSMTTKLFAECRCPPKTAQSAKDGRCYHLFSTGPCENGSYFAPDLNFHTNTTSDRHWGVCKRLQQCPKSDEIYWPQDNTCHQKLTRGPCAKGSLYTINPDTNLPVCQCGEDDDLRKYRYIDGRCYQHFTRGPCQERGFLFLPNRICGCNEFLQQYHNQTQQCFELDTTGPCSGGEIFHKGDGEHIGTCKCKQNYIRYLNSSSCYRPFTQGPCTDNHFLVNETLCLKQPCVRGYLFFPHQGECYRVGTQGPCIGGRIVTFDFTSRPSVDGVSYNGVCSCDKQSCDTDTPPNSKCDKGWVKYGGRCYKLYTKGPCRSGAWLFPHRGSAGAQGICECIPGYTRRAKWKTEHECLSPTVILADYLNKNFSSK